MTKKTILIVEDNSYYRKKAKEIANILGYKTFLATDGVKGVELYKKLKPNYVIMDICMPYMDGIEATKEIINFDINAKIIICSSLNFVKRYREKAIKSGAFSFLKKNFTKEDLLDVIEEIKIIESN